MKTQEKALQIIGKGRNRLQTEGDFSILEVGPKKELNRKYFAARRKKEP